MLIWDTNGPHLGRFPVVDCPQNHVYLPKLVLSYLVAVFLKCAINYNPTPAAGVAGTFLVYAGAFLVYARRLALTP